MVKNAATAIEFLEDLKTGLQPKFDAELEEFRQLKVKETGDSNASSTSGTGAISPTS